MTCCVALKFKDSAKQYRVIVGAESLTTLESTRLVNVCNDSKIIEFDNFTMLISGEGPISDVLDYIKSVDYPEGENDWAKQTINTKQECIDFITYFLDKFQERTPETNNEDLKYEFLFTNGNKIWWAINGPSVFEIGTFWACGSGSAYALGYLESVYDSITSKNAEKSVHRAIEIACKYDLNCGLNIQTKEV